MSAQDDEFLAMLRATFKVEAAEHLQTITTGVLQLEKSPAPEVQRGLIESVFRAAHSLKGAARAVDFVEIESLCQLLEDKFAAWRRQEGRLSPDALDALHLTLNAIEAAMSPGAGSGAAPAPPPAISAAATPTINSPERPAAAISASRSATPAASLPPVPAAEPTALATEGTVRIAVAKLDARLVAAEEMLTAKLTIGQRVADLRELTRRFETWKTEWAAVEPEARALRQTLERRGAGSGPREGESGRGSENGSGNANAPGSGASLARLLEFIEWNHDNLKAIESNVAALTRAAQQDRHVIGKLVDDLLEDSKNLLLLPFATVAAAFPKLVRDLCRDQGKEAAS